MAILRFDLSDSSNALLAEMATHQESVDWSEDILPFDLTCLDGTSDTTIESLREKEEKIVKKIKLVLADAALDNAVFLIDAGKRKKLEDRMTGKSYKSIGVQTMENKSLIKRRQQTASLVQQAESKVNTVLENLSALKTIQVKLEKEKSELLKLSRADCYINTLGLRKKPNITLIRNKPHCF